MTDYRLLHDYHSNRLPMLPGEGEAIECIRCQKPYFCHFLSLFKSPRMQVGTFFSQKGPKWSVRVSGAGKKIKSTYFDVFSPPHSKKSLFWAVKTHIIIAGTGTGRARSAEHTGPLGV